MWDEAHLSEMCSNSEAGSYLRLIDFVHHSTLGLRVINKKKKMGHTSRTRLSVLSRHPARPDISSRQVSESGKGNSNSHGARPVHLIITMIKWIRTSRLSIKNSLSI